MSAAIEIATALEVDSPKRGRKALPSVVTDDGGAVEVLDSAAAAPVVAELRQNSVTLHKGELAQSLNVAHGMGMFQALDYIQKFSGLARLKWLAERKESGDYKGSSVVNSDGSLRTLKTFEDLCDFVGHSYRKIHEDLQNLSTFGEGLLQAQEALGLGYRDLRLLRAGIKALPPEEQQKVLDDLQRVEGGDEAKALIGELKTQLAQAEITLNTAKADMAAKETVSKSKSVKLDKLNEQLARLTSLSPDEQQKLRAAKALEARKNLDLACHEVVGVLDKVLGIAAAMMEDADMDMPTQHFLHARVALMCDLMSESIINTRIDVDFSTRFTVDYGPEGEPELRALPTDGTAAD